MTYFTINKQETASRLWKPSCVSPPWDLWVELETLTGVAAVFLQQVVNHFLFDIPCRLIKEHYIRSLKLQHRITSFAPQATTQICASTPSAVKAYQGNGVKWLDNMGNSKLVMAGQTARTLANKSLVI